MTTTAVARPGGKSKTLSDAEKMLRVIHSFDYFCDEFVWINDKKSRKPIRFNRYRCQREMSQMLVDGKWPVCLKARQLGITWILAIYTLWRLLTVPNFEACVLQQNRDYAKDFLKRVKFVYQRLPKFLQVEIAGDSRFEINFDHGFGSESSLRVIAGSDTAGRSISGDLMVFDEHPYIPDAKAAREACEPSVEVSGGQIVCLGTSAGPQGDFSDVWQGAPGNGFTRLFFSWDEHPDRDQAWRDKKESEHEGDALFMGREYPSTPDEAFMHAEGRCYPSFSAQKNIQTFDQIGLRKDAAELHRAIDFGSVHPFVCLWVAHWAGEPTGLTVDPACLATIREFMCYRWDKNLTQGREKAKKVDDHTMDALRYLVVEMALAGHVHVFREMYIENSVSLGRTDLSDVHDIHTLSGWVECEDWEKGSYKPGPNAEHFCSTVCDRSGRKTIEIFNIHQLPSTPHERPVGTLAQTEVLDGIRRVNVLIDGTRTIFKTVLDSPEAQEKRKMSSLQLAVTNEEGRAKKARARAKRRQNSLERRYRYH